MLTPLISFFHPERLWLLLLVPLLLLTYLALARRRASRTRTFGIENLSRVLPKQAAWKRRRLSMPYCRSRRPGSGTSPSGPRSCRSPR